MVPEDPDLLKSCNEWPAFCPPLPEVCTPNRKKKATSYLMSPPPPPLIISQDMEFCKGNREKRKVNPLQVTRNPASRKRRKSSDENSTLPFPTPPAKTPRVGVFSPDLEISRNRSTLAWLYCNGNSLVGKATTPRGETIYGCSMWTEDRTL